MTRMSRFPPEPEEPGAVFGAADPLSPGISREAQIECAEAVLADPTTPLLKALHAIQQVARTLEVDETNGDLLIRAIDLAGDAIEAHYARPVVKRQKVDVAAIIAAADAYEADPVNLDDRPESWRLLQELLDAIDEAREKEKP